MSRYNTLNTTAYNDYVHTLWECRYFVSKLPGRFECQNIVNVFPHSDVYSIIEEDIYLITNDMTKNIKIRKQRGEIKAKIMLNQEEDGFQLWQTELVHPLPAPISVWHIILSLLEASGDVRYLSSYAHVDGIAEALQTMDPNLRLVKVGKSRSSYRMPSAQVEVVRVTIGSEVISSVEFEAIDITQARSIREQLSAHDLGVPGNYVSLCSYMAFKQSKARTDF